MTFDEAAWSYAKAAEDKAAEQPPTPESNMAKEQNGLEASRRKPVPEEKKTQTAEWAVGKSEKEIKVRASELGVASATIYAWRRGVGLAKPQPTAKQAERGLRRQYTEEEKRVLVAEFRAAPDRKAWGKQVGVNEHIVRRWSNEMGSAAPGPARSKRLGRPPGKQSNYSVEFKRKVLTYAAQHNQKLTMAKFRVSTGAITKWRREEAQGVLTDRKTALVRWRGAGALQARQREDLAEAPEASDVELLAADRNERVSKREHRDELRTLRQEVLVLRANLALAREQGYMKWLDIETMFTGRK